MGPAEWEWEWEQRTSRGTIAGEPLSTVAIELLIIFLGPVDTQRGARRGGLAVGEEEEEQMCANSSRAKIARLSSTKH